jgi:glycosyltransferase involved in cell wall biosynthesis
MTNASVIIPTYNRGKLLCSTLKNLSMNLPPNTEIIITDQSEGVHDETMEIVKKYTDVIHYYKIFIRGLPHTRNYGISKATVNIIIFCNDDVIIHPNFIKNHIKDYEDKEIWSVVERIINVGNQYRYSNIVNTEDTVKIFITNHCIRRIESV